MGRNLLIASLFIGKDLENYTDLKNLLIATSHFESLNNSKLRKDQLNVSFSLLNESANSFLMGDFNFDSTWENEENNIDKNFKDCWFEYRFKHNLDNEDRYTMPKNEYFSAWRPDRILYKSNDNILELDYFEIIGKEEIPQNILDNKVKTPSDHYGLFALFNLKK
jgi:hypothetical protein